MADLPEWKSLRCMYNYGTIEGFHITNGKSIDNNGGGIYNNSGSVDNCVIHNNTAIRGGGIYNVRGNVTNCLIYSNSAMVNGGGIYNNNGEISNCILNSNSTLNYGGGVYLNDGSLINCSFYGNWAESNGGGSFINHGMMTNCIFWNNINGDITGNLFKVYYSCFREALNEYGNIRENPLFINTSGDPSTWNLHLQNGSPCIDTGTTDTAQLPDKDIEGNPRPGGDGKVCMGAYESPDHFSPSPLQPLTRIYVSKSGNNTNGDSWDNAMNSITGALYSLENDLYEIWVAEGVYQEGDAISVSGYTKLYGGFAGNETSLEERNIADNLTIIDGAQTYRCINNCGYIDGLYVRNGKEGGIQNENGKVFNCTIYSNSARSGGGIRNNYGSLSNSILYSNTADTFGGGIYNFQGDVTNCVLFSNSADISGGIANTYGTVSNCLIYFNSAVLSGGIGNNGTVKNCTLYANSAIEDGGGIGHCEGIISNCIIHFNTAGNFGGGIYHEGYHGLSSIKNCILSYNMNWGIYNKSGGVFNSTLYNNEGGIFNVDDYISGYVMNCISWQNGETDIEGGIVSYSCFKEADGTNGNINSDPMFIKTDGSPSTWIYQVKNGSPCIDAGNPSASYNDACQPPGKGSVGNDMGAYGGRYNCNWGINITQNNLIGFLTGRNILYNLQFPFADFNSDDKVDIADLIVLSQDLSSVSPKYP